MNWVPEDPQKSRRKMSSLVAIVRRGSVRLVRADAGHSVAPVFHDGSG